MCSHYWPAAGEKKQCGKYLTVELTDERAYEDYVHRDFKITFTDEVVSGTDREHKLSEGHFIQNAGDVRVYELVSIGQKCHLSIYSVYLQWCISPVAHLLLLTLLNVAH